MDDPTNPTPAETQQTPDDHGPTLPPPPPVQPAQCPSCEEGHGWRRFGCFLLVIFVLLLIWHLFSGPAVSEASRFTPANAMVYVEVNKRLDIEDALAKTPLWQPEKGSFALEELQKQYYPVIARHLGNIEDITIHKIAANIEGGSFARVPVAADRLGWIVALRVQDTKTVVDQLMNLVASKTESIKIEQQDEEYPVEKLTLHSGTPLYVITRGTFVILSPEESLITFALTKNTEQASVADLCVTRSGKVPSIQVLSRMKPLVSQYQNLHALPPFNPTIEKRFDMAAAVNPNARLVTRVQFTPSGTRIETDMIAPEEVKPRGMHPVLCYTLWTLLIIVLIIIGVPVVFLLIVLLLAGYFYVASWWRGELSLQRPITTPELSPQAKEDLGVPSAPTAEEAPSTEEESTSDESKPEENA